MEHREKKILLVHDEPAILDLFKNYLKQRFIAIMFIKKPSYSNLCNLFCKKVK